MQFNFDVTLHRINTKLPGKLTHKVIFRLHLTHSLINETFLLQVWGENDLDFLNLCIMLSICQVICKNILYHLWEKYNKCLCKCLFKPSWICISSALYFSLQVKISCRIEWELSMEWKEITVLIDYLTMLAMPQKFMSIKRSNRHLIFTFLRIYISSIKLFNFIL